MAKDQGQVAEKKKVVNTEAPTANAKASAASDHCKSEGCKKKTEKFSFCAEHYELYMAGVIRGDGKKPVDYFEKFQQFQKQHQKKAA